LKTVDKQPLTPRAADGAVLAFGDASSQGRAASVSAWPVVAGTDA